MVSFADRSSDGVTRFETVLDMRRTVPDVEAENLSNSTRIRLSPNCRANSKLNYWFLFDFALIVHSLSRSIALLVREIPIWEHTQLGVAI